MRRLRDYAANLAQLYMKVRELHARRVAQFGELVIACKADTLPIELLAGALLEAAGEDDASRQEAWRVRGATKLPKTQRRARSGAIVTAHGNGR